ncbi:MAG: polyphenol oxidase family protein [Gemmatimonadota bacterium]|nr:polyphenol oxidase family protein [Gemmatimonadota bacterium]
MLRQESIDEFLPWGVRAFTTTRAAGSFGTGTNEPADAVARRWEVVREALLPFGPRFTTARQVHGNSVVRHDDGWLGWRRVDGADGHFAASRGTGMAVTVADCVPVFVAHQSGACALLHSGWRGTVARIIECGIAAFRTSAFAPADLRVHLGPAICGRCYEVSPDVYAQLTGRVVERPATVDLRAILAGHAAAQGVRGITISPFCTRCDNARFFSHRAGDAGRQLGVMIAEV